MFEASNKEGETAVHIPDAARLPAIDVAGGLQRLMNNKKLYLSLLNRFKGREMSDELITNIKSTDFPSIKKGAHALKGVASNLALIELAHIASVIEERAKAETECSDMIAALNDAVEEVNRSIKIMSEGESI